jgi:hypothetical protein
MKTTPVALLIIVLLSVAAATVQNRDQQLIANERALQDAIGKADKAAFRSLVLILDGLWTTPTTNGFVPAKLLADGLEHFQLTKWDIINPRVTWLDANSAIVASTWSATGLFWDRPVTPMTLSCTVWTKRNGKWLAVVHQESDLQSR